MPRSRGPTIEELNELIRQDRIRREYQKRMCQSIDDLIDACKHLVKDGSHDNIREILNRIEHLKFLWD